MPAISPDRLAWLATTTQTPRPRLAVMGFDAAAATAPPHSDMPLAPLAGDLFGEQWLTDETPRADTLAGWSVTATDHLAMACRFVAEDSTPLAERARAVYQDLFAVQRQLDLAYPLRIWHVLSDVTAGPGEDQRYRQFCRGRAEALAEVAEDADCDWQILPPATLVGGEQPGLWLAALLGDTPVTAIENPRQVSAYAYPSRYAARAPAFARAGVITAGASRALLISGTAAIVGHESQHPGDVIAQLDEALANITAVIAAARPQIGEHELTDLACLKLYVRRPEDAERVLARARARVPGIPMAVLAATICRDELLVELEAHLFVAVTDTL